MTVVKAFAPRPVLADVVSVTVLSRQLAIRYFGTSGAAVLSAFRLEMRWRVSPRMVTASGVVSQTGGDLRVGSATFDGMTTT